MHVTSIIFASTELKFKYCEVCKNDVYNLIKIILAFRNRDDTIDAVRGILDSDNEVEMEEEVESQDMEVDCGKNQNYKLYKEYGRMLMLSEWMLEVPEDFIDKWIMVPCPTGKRVIVIAGKVIFIF